MLTREELQEKKLSILKEFIHSDEQIDPLSYTLRTTSGTSTGKPLVSLNFHTGKAAKRFDGLQNPTLFYGSQNARLSNALFFLTNKTNEGSSMLLLTAEDLSEDLGQIFDEFKPDSFVGFPSFIVRALEYIKNSSVLNKIRNVRFTGEMITALMERIYREKLPNATFESSYTSVDVGSISGEHCPYLKRNHFHPHPHIKLDLVNIDENGVGEIAVTRENGSLLNFKKYIIGDLAKFYDTPCACGQKLTFELIGRKNIGYIRVLGTTLFQEEFDRVFDLLSLYVKDYQVLVSTIELDGRAAVQLQFEIVPNEVLFLMDEPETFIISEIAESLYVTSDKTLSDMMSQKIYIRPTIKFSTAEASIQGNKTVKLRYVIE